MSDKDKKVTFVRNTNMADRRKQIEQLYDGSDEGIRRLFDKAAGANAGARYNETTVNQLLNQVGTETINKKDILSITNYAYATDPNYANIMDYLGNMFMWRYYYFPVQKKETAKDSDYGELYSLMTEIVDGLSIETTFPTIITKLLKEGAVYLYSVKNSPSKTISTIVLNSVYCKPIMMSQYGTGLFQFDTKYFDDLGFRGQELDQILEYFPDELVKAYKDYKGGGAQKIVLDGRYSTYLSLNDFGFASRLSVLKSLFDYNQYRANEVERSNAQLDRIMTHKIPSYENRLLFELAEVKALHKSMSRSLGGNTRTKLVTTFGDVQLHPVMETSKFSSESLEKGQQNIYKAAGINSDLFSGKTKESLEVSLTKDQSIIWKYIQQLINFYNITINNLYNFRGYQLELTMLPITHYNLNTMMELHRRNAEYGIGRLEAVIASGTKQKHIVHKGKLEDFLKLDEILKPLASSHTKSAQDSKNETEEENPKKEDEKEVKVEEKTAGEDEKNEQE